MPAANVPAFFEMYPRRMQPATPGAAHLRAKAVRSEIFMGSKGKRCIGRHIDSNRMRRACTIVS